MNILDDLTTKVIKNCNTTLEEHKQCKLLMSDITMKKFRELIWELYGEFYVSELTLEKKNKVVLINGIQFPVEIDNLLMKGIIRAKLPNKIIIEFNYKDELYKNN